MVPDERRPGRRPLTARGTAIIALASITPFIDFVARNQQLVASPRRALTYALATALLGLALAAGVTTVVRRADRDAVAAATAALVLCTFTYSAVFGTSAGSSATFDLARWAIGTAAIVAGVAWLAHRPLAMTFLTAWVGALFLVTTISYARARPPAETPRLAVPSAIDALNAVDAVRTPDIYWFVLDEYGRADQLSRIAGEPVHDLADDLDDRGFATSRSSWASYARTHQSLASTASGDLVGGRATANDFLQYGAIAVGDNATVRRLRDHGYSYVHSDPATLSWLACDDDIADLCLPPAHHGIALDEHDDALLRRTPLAALLPTTRPYTDPVQVLDALASRTSDRPRFVFAHVLSPHGPFRYDDDCALRDDWLVTEQLSAERTAAYLHELPCTDALLLEAVDRIISSDPEAIVIVQSDHGSALEVEVDIALDELTDAQIAERFAVVNALRLPPGCPTALEGAPLVDTFHIVFACLEGRAPTSVPWKAFWPVEGDDGAVQPIDPSRFAGAP